MKNNWLTLEAPNDYNLDNISLILYQNEGFSVKFFRNIKFTEIASSYLFNEIFRSNNETSSSRLVSNLLKRHHGVQIVIQCDDLDNYFSPK
ncbi:hypothetical protein BpHYR1_014833 [Brachionus plicatilis]|uniref:Uncharacterized protein n=1 Tax=Brachionus plicatilis TaxID=10195 RepID=A0A3M7QJG0_BRAPC|nr:hypothetical protein BpHYR1_014833 [Brachionus plicatilis]